MKLKQLSKLALAATLSFGAVSVFTATTPEVSAKKVAKKSTKKKAAAKQSSKYQKYVGTIGKYNATLFLDIDDNGKVSGYYYYGNGSKGKLTIKGSTGEMFGTAGFTLNFNEYDSNGNVTGTWDAEINGISVAPLQRVWLLNGEMTTSAGKTYEVEMSLE